MSAQEFILIPKNQYLSERPLAERILNDSSIKEKSAQLALLNQRDEDADKPIPKKQKLDLTPNLKQNEDLDQEILRATKLTKGKLRSSTEILRLLRQKFRVSENKTIIVDGRDTNISVVNFLYSLQQPRTNINRNPIYLTILKRLQLDTTLVQNAIAKQISNGPNEEKSDDESSEDGFETSASNEQTPARKTFFDSSFNKTPSRKLTPKESKVFEDIFDRSTKKA